VLLCGDPQRTLAAKSANRNRSAAGDDAFYQLAKAFARLTDSQRRRLSPFVKMCDNINPDR
jgi:hypothetical protein